MGPCFFPHRHNGARHVLSKTQQRVSTVNCVRSERSIVVVDNWYLVFGNYAGDFLSGVCDNDCVVLNEVNRDRVQMLR